MSVHAVLLVPAEGDPHGLLAVNFPDVKPPMAWRDCFPDDPWQAGWLDDWELMTDRLNQHVCALALAWEGKPVVEGLDRYARALGGYRYPDTVGMDTLVHTLTEQVQTQEWGTLVLLRRPRVRDHRTWVNRNV